MLLITRAETSDYSGYTISPSDSMASATLQVMVTIADSSPHWEGHIAYDTYEALSCESFPFIFVANKTKHVTVVIPCQWPL